MQKVCLVIGLLFFVNSICIAQEAGNAARYQQGQQPSQNPFPTNGNLQGSEQTRDVSDVYFLEARVLMNLSADSYSVSFGVSQEGKTAQESEQKVDAAISSFVGQLQSLGITQTDVFVDFISQNPVYDFSASNKTAKENLVGYQTKKNVLIRYKDRNALKQISNAASQNSIYDLIKVDFVLNDTTGIRSKMLQEAARVIKSKETTFTTLGINLKPVAVVSEGFKTFSPDERYFTYTAYESGNAEGFKRVVEKRKPTTSYYQPLDATDYDAAINAQSLEPQIQAVMLLRVKYLPTVKPEILPASDRVGSK